MFEQVYHHPFHNPGLFWAVGIPFVLYLASRLRSGERPAFITRWFLLFQLEILLDAGLQGELTPLSGAALQTVSIMLVVAGDLRFLLLLVWQRRGRPAFGSWAAAALGWSLFVPLASYVVAQPIANGQPRVLFLVYETMFASMALALAVVSAQRPVADATDRWIRRLIAFELVQYTLWASADVIILSGHDLGYLLRLIPNTLYYAAFMPFAWWTAPPEVRG